MTSLSVEPAANLEPVEGGDRWRSTADCPLFDLKADRPLAAGWWLLDADLAVAIDRQVEATGRPLTSRSQPMGFDAFELRPSLRVIADRSVEPVQFVPLRKPRGGRLRALVELPERLTSLALEPCRAPATVRIRNVRLRRLSGWRLVLAGWRELLRSPGGLRTALRRWRDGGLPWLKVAVRQAARHDYRRWIDRFDTPTRGERQRTQAWVEQSTTKAEGCPRFRVIVEAGASVPGELLQTVESLREQRWPDWQLIVVAPTVLMAQMLPGDLADPRIVRFAVDRGEPAEILAALVRRMVLDSRSIDWVTRLTVGDRLHAQALVRLARGIEEHPDSQILFGDDDWIDRLGRRRDPRFFEDWDIDLVRSGAMTEASIWFRADRFFSLFDEDSTDAPRGSGKASVETMDELLLRTAETVAVEAVTHVSRPILHRKSRVPKRDNASFERRLSEHLERMQEAGQVTRDDDRLRLLFPAPEPLPRVSLIVGTRDRVDLLRPLISDLLERTDYGLSSGASTDRSIEIVIVDNGSSEPETLAFLEQIVNDHPDLVQVVRYDAPFNHSAIYNLGVDTAQGEIVVLLNNDLRVRDAGWLREMVVQLSRPGVGAVGAKLLYGRAGGGRIQHGGVVLGLGRGIAGHAGRGAPPSHPGRCGALRRVRRVSAVTAACMALRRERFLALGGFDSEHLAVAYNDVDLCLLLAEAGERILWTPFACLDHLEGQSRGADDDRHHAEHDARLERLQREEATIRSRWGDRLQSDPWYNPNLTLESEDALLSLAPRTRLGRAEKAREHPTTKKLVDDAP